MPYPPVAHKDTDFALTVAAGEYLQRLCPNELSTVPGFAVATEAATALPDEMLELHGTWLVVATQGQTRR